MKQTRKQQLMEQMKLLAEQILIGDQAHLPTGKLKEKFGKLSSEYKRYWLRDFNKQQNA
jgi:hypothetical protein